MHDGTKDQMQVTFPASQTFVAIGRVTATGLAGRLGVDAAIVEELRLAVDEAVVSLGGSGRISLVAEWKPGRLSIGLENPEARLDSAAASAMEQRLTKRVDHASVNSTQISLALIDPLTATEPAPTEPSESDG